MTSTQDTKEEARQTAATAVDEGKHVAGVAGDEARNVVGEAKSQARGLIDDALDQVDDQSRTQRDRLVGTLQSFSSDLDEMASSGGSGIAAELAKQVADRSRSLGQHLDGREPSDILDDVRRFARQRPAVFLLGALGAGVVVGRLARGAKQAKTSGTGTGTDTTPEAPSPVAAPSYGQPQVAVPPTHGDPVYPGTPIADAAGADSPSGTGPQGYLP